MMRHVTSPLMGLVSSTSLFFISIPFINADGAWYSALKACPQTCEISGVESRNWTTYSDIDRLVACREAVSLDFAIYNPIDDASTNTLLYACTGRTSGVGAQDAGNSTCGKPIQQDAQMQTFSEGSVSNTTSILAAAQQAQMKFSQGSCNGTSSVGYANGAVVAVYAGSQIQNEGVAAFVQNFMDSYRNDAGSAPKALQVCGSGRNAHYNLGIFATQESELSPKTALTSAQSALKSWADGECASFDGSSSWSTTKVWQVSEFKSSNATSSNATISGNQTTNGTESHLTKRAECEIKRLGPEDHSCHDMAVKCDIEDWQFTEYNPSPSFCANLRKGQPVCCTNGTMPDVRPKPQEDGTCAVHEVIADDNCADLAAANGLKSNKVIEDFNKNTWGWNGCGNVLIGQRICLSEGDPPMPATLANAVCGPQKPGTEKPTDGTNIVDLNPCPLNACCNVWGQCGIDEQFCTEYDSPTGAPGSAPPGSNGCISSCGTDIVNKKSPSKYIKIGYFETWNPNRPCLHMDIRQMKGGGYTHIHWAFGNLTEDFKPEIHPDLMTQFEYFKNMTDIKKIISFGGWSFSTLPSTYTILRSAVRTQANRETFAKNIMDFLDLHDLDGVDIDWEYAGAPDIPGIPAGDKEDPKRYLEFLKYLSKELDYEKSLSICAPASFWYLQPFPIKEMHPLLDYIVYMTYDLHGQWDHGNPWSSPGCPQTGCLRSHVNLTETNLALAMITKAGVPTDKITVGVSSYGRAFLMNDPSCTGPHCTFSESPANPGECTREGGYLANAEINDVYKGKSVLNPRAEGVNYWFDLVSHSDMMTWGDQWVAWMSDDTKSKRTGLYKSYGMLGTVDWATDLQYHRVAYDDNNPDSNGIDPDHITCDDLILDRHNVKWNNDTWERTGARTRWDQVMDVCKNEGEDDWCDCVGDELGGPDGMACGYLTESSNCGRVRDWDECKAQGSADFAILNSMAGIHNYYKDLRDNFRDAVVNAMLNDLTPFGERFGMKAEDNSAKDVAKTVKTMLIGIFSSFAMATWAGNVGVQLGKAALDAAKWGAINGAVRVVNRASTPVEADGLNDRIGREGLGAIMHYVVNTTEMIAEEIFSGHDQSPEMLGDLMSSGVYASSDNDFKHMTSSELYDKWKPLLFGPLLPYYWAYGNSKGFGTAYVFNTTTSCLGNFESSNKYVKQAFTQEMWDRQCTCNHGSVWWFCLVTAVHSGIKDRMTALKQPPRGIEYLWTAKDRNPPKDGVTGAWSDVTVRDLIHASLDTFRFNYDQNLGKQIDVSKVGPAQSIAEEGIMAPGVIGMPICESIHQAWENYVYSDKTEPGWPCLPYFQQFPPDEDPAYDF